MTRRIAHVCIGATDLAAVERLYCEGLGFERRFDFTKAGRLVGFYLHAGNETFLEVFLSDAVPPHGNPIRHFCIEVDDLDAVRSRVQAMGYVVTDKAMGADHTWQFWIRNAPDGVQIELQQYTPESCQQTGRPCEITW
jgi:catechol 2,3-dioxygenase-like lactoylglutathione lyase family enzyme